jgi:biopolymer transport protein ExbB/TolQ
VRRRLSALIHPASSEGDFAVSRITSISEWLLRQSLLWGGLACLAFYAFVVQGTEPTSTIYRYFGSHPINYSTTIIFFVGLAVLVIKLLGLLVQFATLDVVRLPETEAGNQRASDVPGLLAALDNLSASLQRSYLGQRLRNALIYIQRKGSADTLESHLHYLEDADLANAQQSYALVRIIFSTIPILGFLGTVVGITMAIARLDISAAAMDKSLPAVIAGLSVAFDTTAQSLVLSTVLLFVKFCVEKVEHRLLAGVDASATEQLVGRFAQYGSERDAHLASVNRMVEQLTFSFAANAEKQGAVFTQSLEQMGLRCNQLLDNSAALLHRAVAGASTSLEESFASAATALDEALSGAVVEGLSRHAKALNQGVEHHTKRLEETLIRHAELLNDGLEHHAGALAQAEATIAEENRRHLAEVEAAVGEAMLIASTRQEKLISKSEQILGQMQTALVEAAGTSVAQHEQLVHLGDILLRLVEGSNQVQQLGEALQTNLHLVNETHNFQQTVASLTAILQLLGAHLGKSLVAGENILDLSLTRHQTKAA